MKTQDKTLPLRCNLTSEELRKRKKIVLAHLKQATLEKQELRNGFVFKFPGTDAMLDALVEFVKTERTCCSFFDFELHIGSDKQEAALKLTGPEGAKNFIITELGL